MPKPINTGFQILAPEPVDSRTVKATYSELASIPVVYEGLLVYVKDSGKEWRYKGGAWVEITTTGAEVTAEWGQITGDIQTQTDLQNLFALKFDKTGGIITGETTVQAIVNGDNFILTGSIPSNQTPVQGGDMLAAFYDPNGNGNKVLAAETADNAALVNGLSVLTAVPANAIFTDTVYGQWNFKLGAIATEYPIASNDSFNIRNGAGISLAWLGTPDNRLTISLDSVLSITPGDYTNSDITVDEYGRITAIANGTGGGSSTPIDTTWENVTSVPGRQAGMVLNIAGSADPTKDYGKVVLLSSTLFIYDNIAEGTQDFIRIT